MIQRLSTFHDTNNILKTRFSEYEICHLDNHGACMNLYQNKQYQYGSKVGFFIDMPLCYEFTLMNNYMTSKSCNNLLKNIYQYIDFEKSYTINDKVLEDINLSEEEQCKVIKSIDSDVFFDAEKWLRYWITIGNEKFVRLLSNEFLIFPLKNPLEIGITTNTSSILTNIFKVPLKDII